MSRILITGATGNIGVEVVRFLSKSFSNHSIVAGVRTIEKAKIIFADIDTLEYVHFDFEKPETFKGALANIDRIFLLRPPHISDTDTYFKPLLDQIKSSKINEVVFLSVQGAEKSKVIPHHKIEKLIEAFGLDHIFLRPSYFMQNLTTTLLNDIQTKHQIILPAGNAKFNWVDVANIGELAAIFLDRFVAYKNKAYEITGDKNMTFQDVVNLINTIVKNPIQFQDVNPFRFYWIKKKEGMAKGMILVLILLHFLRRFQKEPRISPVYEEITGKEPSKLKDFIKREKIKFEQI